MQSFGASLHHLTFSGIGALPSASRATVLRRLFDSRFRRCDPWSYETRESERARIDQIVGAASPLDPQSIVELGCAEGVLSRALIDQFPLAHLHAVDISERAVHRARVASGPGHRFDVADVRYWPGPTHGRADLVIATDLLYYVPVYRDRHRLMNKASSWLRDGGYLILGHATARARQLHASSVRGTVFANAGRALANFGTYRIDIYQKPLVSPVR